MKKFNITIARHAFSEPIEVFAETEEEARNKALDIAEGDSWIFPKNKELYEVEKVKEEEYPYIDREGNPYDEGSGLPAGGGLSKKCKHNADALYAYYIIKNRYDIGPYLTDRGFVATFYGNDMEVWHKDNTEIVFEGYDERAGFWAYVHTELIKGK